jgi:hypothetical protein
MEEVQAAEALLYLLRDHGCVGQRTCIGFEDHYLLRQRLPRRGERFGIVTGDEHSVVPLMQELRRRVANTGGAARDQRHRPCRVRHSRSPFIVFCRPSYKSLHRSPRQGFCSVTYTNG